MVLLILIPFGISSLISREVNFLQFIQMILTVVGIICFCTFLATYLKRKFGGSIIGLLIVLGVAGTIGALEYFKIFSLFTVSMNVFRFIINTPFAFAIIAVLAFAAVWMNKLFFRQHYYLAKFSKRSETVAASGREFTFLNRFGTIGEIISLQIKLIWRHKRTKSVLYMSFFFLLYGLIFYTSPSYETNYGLLFFGAMFTTGAFMLMFGQWIISWDGSHFDFLMTQRIDAGTYISANYMTLVSLNVISFIITTPYFLFGEKVIWMFVTAFLYNVGVNSMLYLLTASFNTKRLDLSKGNAMNYQGTTYKNFLFVLPMMFLPWILISIISAFGHWKLGLIILAVLGMLGILLNNVLLGLITQLFLKRKYSLCEGFRKKES